MKVVIPELRGLNSPDIINLDEASFAQEEPFCVLIQAMFGQQGEDGEESFDFLVCNAVWVQHQVLAGAFSGRHYLIVSTFCLSEIQAFWMRVATMSSGHTWEEVAQKLGRYGLWEFEDYQDFSR